MTTDLQKLTQILTGLLLLMTLAIPAFAQPTIQKANLQNLLQNRQTGFEENRGQLTDQNGLERKDVKYIYSAPGFKLVLKSNCLSYEVYTLEKKKKNQEFSEATGPVPSLIMPDKSKKPEEVTVKNHRIDVSFEGANPNPQILAEGKSADYKNYYLAHTPEKGVTNVFTYNKLTYKNLYPNIDIVFYAKEDGKLKYDIVVHTGGKLENVKMKYDGADRLTLAEGKLKLKTALGEIEEEIPYSFLEENNQEVHIKHVLKNNNEISFIGKYDLNKTLIVDPQLIWGTYYGGSKDDKGNCIATNDSDGFFIVGLTYSSSAIATSGTFQTTFGGSTDAFLVRLTGNGVRKWGTYFGGSNDDWAQSISIDRSGYPFVTGSTLSTTGLATIGAHQTSGTSSDAFIAMFDVSGKRVWSSYYGGSGYETGNSITLDANDNVFITGQTNSTSGIASSGAHLTAPGGGTDAFIAKLNRSGVLQWATYYGGTKDDIGHGIRVDRGNNVYVVGQTLSTSGISTTGAHQTFGGNYDAFVVKFNNNGVRKWGTYYGGSNIDYGFGINIDKNNNILITGTTVSSSNIATSGTHKTTVGSNDAFIAKFDSLGARQWGTYFGGSSGEEGKAIATDADGNVFITGSTTSNSGIATSGAYQTLLPGYDVAFVAKFSSLGKQIWGTYYGSDSTSGNGIVVDKSNNVYITGNTPTNSKIATSGAHQTLKGGQQDAFMAKFTGISCKITSFIAKDSVCANAVQKYKVNHAEKVNYDWFVYNGTIISGQGTDSLEVLWGSAGMGFINIIVESVVQNCKDSIFKTITILNNPQANIIPDTSICLGQSINIGGASSSGSIYSWTSKPAGFTSASSDPLVSPTVTTTYYLTETLASIGCSKTDSVTITVNDLPSARFSFQNACKNETVLFTDTSKSAVSYFWHFGDGSISNSQHPQKIYKNAGTYTVSQIVTSANGCRDSISRQINIYELPTTVLSGPTNVCPTSTTSYKANSNDTNITYNWKITGGNIVNGQGTDSISINWSGIGTGFVKVILTNASDCIDSVNYGVKIDSFGCNWVWPGDANHNKIANAWDVLNLALAYNDTGAARKNASPLWVPQFADNWSKTFKNGLNFKHADCNGDGIVDTADLQPIRNNYNRTWKKTGASQTAAGPNDATLLLEFEKGSFYAGDTVHVTMKLGTATIQAKDVYALAFSFTFDPRLVDSGTVKVNLSNSWLGTAGTDLISFVKEFNDQGLADIAIARIDKKNASGYGNIGTLNFVVKDDIAGKRLIEKILKSDILDLLSISANEDTIPLNTFGDSTKIQQLTTGIKDKETKEVNNNIQIYPNPSATGNFILDLKDLKSEKIQVVNILGQEIWNSTNLQGKTEIRLENANAGIYIINVRTGKSMISKRLIINK